jgi:hypothetical protein
MINKSSEMFNKYGFQGVRWRTEVNCMMVDQRIGLVKELNNSIQGVNNSVSDEGKSALEVSK